MILTKDNILRFIREQRYVTPTTIAENFDTSTMIASAALSELSKDKLVYITNVKLGSTPYYYDPNQKESLIEIGEAQFSKYEKQIFEKLKEQQIINHGALSIQEQLAIQNIKDFAYPLDIEYNGEYMKFWVWYLRDLKETKKQILEVLKEKETPSQKEKKPEKQKRNYEDEIESSKRPRTFSDYENNLGSSDNSYSEYEERIRAKYEKKSENVNKYTKKNEPNDFVPTEDFKPTKQVDENQEEIFIENFLQKHYLKIENKQKNEKGILYETSLKVGSMITVLFDAFYFNKKPNEADIFKFYNSSQKPKIIFLTNAPKKIYNLAEILDNLTIINV
jgi:hypothetical protein